LSEPLRASYRRLIERGGAQGRTGGRISEREPTTVDVVREPATRRDLVMQLFEIAQPNHVTAPETTTERDSFFFSRCLSQLREVDSKLRLYAGGDELKDGFAGHSQHATRPR
jgi:hypothetical protein